MLTCVPGALASPKTVFDSWLLLPIAGARVEPVHPSQPILSLSNRRPIITNRFDLYYIRGFREAANRIPNNTTAQIPCPYSFSQATSRNFGPEPPQPQPGEFILEELVQGIPPLPTTVNNNQINANLTPPISNFVAPTISSNAPINLGLPTPISTPNTN